MPEQRFALEFHRLDGNGRVPREEFFDALSSTLFRGVPAKDTGSTSKRPLGRSRAFSTASSIYCDSLRAQDWRSSIVANGGVSSQSAKIENSGLTELIDASVIATAFGSKKPAPAILRHMIDAFRIDPERSWFVGDDPHADGWDADQVAFRTCWVERCSI